MSCFDNKIVHFSVIILIEPAGSCIARCPIPMMESCGKTQPWIPAFYRLDDIEFGKARGRKLYCYTATTDNAVQIHPCGMTLDRVTEDYKL
jgi:hypothetical protein